MSSRFTTLQVRTPEGITFSFLLASPIARFLAWSIDVAVIGALQSIVGGLLRILGLLDIDLMRAFVILSYFVVSIGYGMLLEWYWRGQTIGKKVMRLRVIDERGLRLQPSQVVVRNLLRFVDMQPALYVVGGIAALVSRRCQRLGDFAANTIVIRQPRVVEPDLDQVRAGQFNSLRAHPHLEARLRQAVSPELAGLALQAVMRRDQIEDESRVALFKHLADHFREQVPYPPEVLENLSDEQYVRNVVDTVFRKATG
jgi:uncharacterized RDD family membrane protein YckC